jgi:hypothetical protein
MKLRVKGGTQANHRGRVYGPGETFECSHQESWFYLLMLDCAEPVKDEGPKRRRTRKTK